MKSAVAIVPPVADVWYPQAMIVPTMSTMVIKREAIKGIRTIPYTPSQTRVEETTDMGEIRAVKPR